MKPLVAALEGSLIVSCQAYPGEPLRDPEVTAKMAAAVVDGGASAVRVQGIDDIKAVKQAVSVPVIGLWKDGQQGVFITPTLNHALAVAAAGADIVALDGTRRDRPDGLTLAQTVAGLRDTSQALIMADCDSLPSAVAAAEAGVDLIGTTLAGYTPGRAATEGPDLELIRELAAELPAGSVVIAEGRVHTPAQAAAAREAGAFAVVVGTAITHPTSITRWFDQSIRGVDDEGDARE